MQVMHANNPEGAALLAEVGDQRFDCTWLPVGTLSPVLGAHTGPSMVGVCFAPLATWQAAEPHRARLHQLREVQRLLGVVFPQPEDGRDWLFSAVPALHGQRPIDLIRSGDIAAVTLPMTVNTRPCMSGATTDWKIANTNSR